MTRWLPQHYRTEGKDQDFDPTIIDHAIATAQITTDINPKLAPVFTLRHLAYLSGTDYGFLRAVVSRANDDPYRVFRIRKKPTRDGKASFRVIAVPNPDLLITQRWITQNILSHALPHAASVAFTPGDKLINAARPHCRARWLIKLDVRNFFESITEVAVYRVFLSLGYQPLVAFEMARLCTRLGTPTRYRRQSHWLSQDKTRVISSYNYRRMGHLPQGAPTSPMLANLAVRKFDETIDAIACTHGLTYTRYADDLSLSTKATDFSRKQCLSVIQKIYASMGCVGLSPNVTKTRIATPGSRMIVLGLLVDGKVPKLTRDFKAGLRQHIHFLSRSDIGPAQHTRAKNFTSISGLKHHVFGLATFAAQIEPEYGKDCLRQLSKVDWPV